MWLWPAGLECRGGDLACMGGDEGRWEGEAGGRPGADLEEGSWGLAGSDTERALMPTWEPIRVL